MQTGTATSGRRRWWPLAVSGLAVVMMGVVLFLAGVPSAPNGGQAPSYPGVPSIGQSSLTSNNPRIGAPFMVSLHAPPGAFVWLLASSQSGPSLVAGYPTALSSDWFFLSGLHVMPAQGRVDLVFPLPFDVNLIDLDFTLQGVAVDPVTFEIGWTNHAFHRITGSPATVKNVLLIKQAVVTPEAPFAPSQADALAAHLTAMGHYVTVVSNSLPASLSGYDCILDCRFTLPGSEMEKTQLVEFMRCHGGVFLLHGPFNLSAWSQQRWYWIQDLLVNRLGIAVTIGVGGNYSGNVNEYVDPMTDPQYLLHPYPTAGMIYKVEHEGGHFGQPGSQPVGTPWIRGSVGGYDLVYGMFFRPVDVMAHPVVAPIAVLFNGAQDAFTAGPENPSPEAVFANLIWYLDR